MELATCEPFAIAFSFADIIVEEDMVDESLVLVLVLVLLTLKPRKTFNVLPRRRPSKVKVEYFLYCFPTRKIIV